MEIHHLKIFTAVYAGRSFTRASEQLHISQPTISEHIKNLEKQLQCTLFDRLGRSIVPTAQADILYPRAREILTALEKLHEDVIDAGEEIKGDIVLGASTIPGTYILPAIVAGFKEKHPGVSFEIRIDDSKRITELVQNHELLLGIVGAKMSNSRLEYVSFVEDELVLAAAADRKLDEEVDISEIRTLPFLLRERGSGTRQWMEDFFLRQGLDPSLLDVIAVLGSSAAVKEAVKADLGVSILSRHAIRDEIDCRKISASRVRGMTMKRLFHIISRKKRSLPKPYDLFRRELIDLTPDSRRSTGV